MKMYLYVVGGTMLSLNAMSGAAYHYGLFGADSNPGVFLYAAFLTFYVFDYFVFERVQLYTYDLIHERLGMKLIWGGLVVYGWLYYSAAVGDGSLPEPRFLARIDLCMAHHYGHAVPARVGDLARREHAEVHVQALA